MIILILACFTIMVCAVPVRSHVLPPLLSQGGAAQAQRVVEATNQLLDAQTPAPQQPQPGVPQQQGPQGGLQFLPPMQHYTWPSLGGSPINLPLQPSFYGSQPANQPILPQQPLIFPPYRYIPLFSSPYGNQLFSPNGFPMILDSPLPQTPANQPPNSPVPPAETPSGAAPSGAAPSGGAPQQVQQQQNPHIVYMLQQPKLTSAVVLQNAPLGSLSSEELQMAAKLGQLGAYLTTVLTNSPAGAVQPVSQSAGLVNPEQQSVVPTLGASLAGTQPTQGPASSGPQPNTSGVPSGLERHAQEAAAVKAPIQEKLVCDCSNRQRELITP